MPRKPLVLTPEGTDYQIRIIGDRPAPLRDFYHALLRLPWPSTIAVIGLGFIVANALFALGFVETGGIAHARPGSFADAFYFSVETMGTIGYGSMYPESTAANLLMVGEAIAGLTLTALATGLVFAKFSRPNARVVFSKQAVISPMNGVPTLCLRIGNERGNRIVDVQLRATLMRTERTTEGGLFYRAVDVDLARSRMLALSRAWTVLHPIDARSPFYGQSPASLVATEVELHLMAVGMDDTSMQTMHASHIYLARDILWGARLADVVTAESNGDLLLDLSKFHDTVPAEPTDDFPYPS